MPITKNINKSTLREFVENVDFGDKIESIPGVGKANAVILRKYKMESVRDMVVTFLELEKKYGKKAIVEFYNNLQSMGINSHRPTISACISHKSCLYTGNESKSAEISPSLSISSVRSEVSKVKDLIGNVAKVVSYTVAGAMVLMVVT